ncbi:response regulator [Cetobacterium sp. 2G large]|uniref:response regulator n=1 Tax=Cetobacterium sp. 2G large TaxID=2759680 RepID=UPI00163B6C8C|nr:response regulator [Cetobacterium sp. 2G large]MBC2853537.1 hypothetical protein [Cetobacterium sp. 2G large]
MNVLIIDDSEKKQFEIRSCIEDVFGKEFKVEIVDNINCAKKALLKTNYDICFLDIQIPRRKKGCIEKEGGVILLNEVRRNINYNNPDVLIITSEYEESIEKLSIEKRLYYMVKYDPMSYEWEHLIKERLILLKRSSEQKKKKVALFAIHGINTRGTWKNDLATVISENRPDIACYLWDYGDFKLKIFNYLERKKVVENFAEFYDRILYGKDYEKVYAVAHSFGTYILFKSLERFEQVRFEKIIFMGSPLKENTNWEKKGANKKFKKLYFYKFGSDWVLKNFSRFAGLGKSGYKGFKKTPSNIEYIDLPGAEHSDGFSKITMKKEWLEKFLK